MSAPQQLPAARPKRASRFTRLRRWAVRSAVVIGALLAAGVGYYCWTRPGPLGPTEVFAGVVYRCERIESDPLGHGLMHLVEIDLGRPGMEMFVTPLDADAVAQGWEYRLQWTPSVAKQENLSVTINGSLFATASRLSRFPGGLARSVETIISEHQLGHYQENSFLLWFEDDLTPHLEKYRRPSADALQRARYGVSGTYKILEDGRPVELNEPADSRVFAGIDARRKRLFLAAFDYVSPARAAPLLAERGVVDAITLDSGTSASLVLGPKARGVRNEVLLWPKRAVATHLGVRAPQLPGG